MQNEHIEKIVEIFANKQDIPHISQNVKLERIKENDYNLSVSSYIEVKDTREITNITELNAQLQEVATKINNLRAEIEKIVNQI